MRPGTVPVAIVLGLLLLSEPAGAQSRPAEVNRALDALRVASSAAAAGEWARALEHYQASQRAAPSVVALEGVANAHFQLRHDAEASAAYRELLALNPELPSDRPEIRREWERSRTTAEGRLRELDARAPKGPTPASDPLERRPIASPRPRERARDRARDEEEKEPRTAKNAIFVEGLGNGLIYSVNYERLLGSPDVGLRVGASYMSIGASGGGASSRVSWASFPLVASYYFGSPSHKLQLGVGATVVHVTGSASSGSLVGSASGITAIPTAVVGYRYIPRDGGFAFSVGFTPMYVPGEGGGFLPWGGLSLGAVL